MHNLKQTLLLALLLFTSVTSYAQTTFALKTSGSIDTSKKYLIVYQSSATATSGILMNSSFTSGATSYAQCAEAGETATISSNQIETDESNAFTFESTGTDGSYYIKNYAGYYFGNYDNGSNNTGHWFAVTNTSSPGSNYYNTISFSNSTVQITGSYNSWVLGYLTSAGDDTSIERSCFHYKDKDNVNPIYLYEEVGSSSSTTHTIDLTLGSASGTSNLCNTWTSSGSPTVTLKSYGNSECTTPANYITTNSLGLYAEKNSTSYFQLSVADGYTILSYKITYDISNMTSTSVSVSSGVDNTVNSQTSEAFYVKSTSNKNSKTVTPTAFTVKVQPITYTINYSLDGGTNSADNPSTYTIETEKITLASPTKSGYTFAGWTNSSGTTVTSIAKGSTGNITLTANWTKPSYTITCTPTTGGTVTANPSAANENDEVTLTLTPNAGYEIGSLSVKDASNVDVTVTNNTFTMPASNVTVTATFTAIPYTITYNLDGGTNASTNPSTYTVESETITLADPTKEDYDFSGWKNAAGTTVTSIAKGTTGDITLTANWTEKTYAIICNTAVNGSISANPAPAAKGASVTLTATPADGYSLSTLLVSYADGTVETSKNDDGTYTFSMPAAAVTVTATFTPITYTITYNLNGGTNASTNPATYTVESETITLAAPTKDECTFDGWTNTAGTAVTTIANGSTGDITLTANWTGKTYDVYCTAAENGSISAKQTSFTKDATVIITIAPNVDYQLETLTVNNEDVTSQVVKNTYTFTMPAAEVTVVATFTDLTLALSDSKPQIIAGNYKKGNVSYLRSGNAIKKGNYGSFCLPFDFIVTDATCFDKVYVPIDVAFYITDTGRLKIFLVNQTGTVTAGTPFVAHLTGEPVNVTNSSEVSYVGTITNPEEIDLTVFDKDNTSSVLIADENIKLKWGGTLVSSPHQEGMNTFNTNGSFGPRTSTSNLSAFRAYLIETIINNDDNTTEESPVKSYELEVNFLDDEETAIQTLMSAEKSGVDVYGINGVVVRRNVNVQHALDGLRPGLYVVGGKKMLKK